MWWIVMNGRWYGEDEEINFFFSGGCRNTSWPRDWSSVVCSSDLLFFFHLFFLHFEQGLVFTTILSPSSSSFFSSFFSSSSSFFSSFFSSFWTRFSVSSSSFSSFFSFFFFSFFSFFIIFFFFFFFFSFSSSSTFFMVFYYLRVVKSCISRS